MGYYFSELGFGGLVFANAFETITELTVLPFLEVLEHISGSFGRGIVSFIAVGLWFVHHQVLAIEFVPAVAFLFLNFYFGTRTIF